MNRLKAFLLCATLVSLPSLVAAASSSPPSSSGEPDSKKSAQSSAERGRAVYANNCARCHGGDGTSQTTMGQMTEAPDLTDAGWQRGKSNSRMLASVAQGRGEMPAFKKKLSRQDIAAAVAYVRTLKR
jgi:cbb3-type cytochrome c oxidase subunit III